MLTGFAIFLGVIMVLVILCTIHGMCKGESFSFFMWVVYFQSWCEILGSCIVVAAKGLTDAATGSD